MQNGCFHRETFMGVMVIMAGVVVACVRRMIVMVMTMQVIGIYPTVTLHSGFFFLFWVIVGAFFAVFMGMLVLMIVFMIMLMVMFVIMSLVFMVMPSMIMLAVTSMFVCSLRFTIIKRHFSHNLITLYHNLNLMFMNLLLFSLFFMAMLLIFMINKALDIFTYHFRTQYVIILIFWFDRIFLATGLRH